ncbi:unnamed protein product [Citrullus colocynthis]|uniref:Uncharacterized protein n=1 Tax=Citrullus colocynthis TaxID=252529 RepID=A0ABP0ZCD9_9ROSI
MADPMVEKLSPQIFFLSNICNLVLFDLIPPISHWNFQITSILKAHKDKLFGFVDGLIPKPNASFSGVLEDWIAKDNTHDYDYCNTFSYYFSIHTSLAVLHLNKFGTF